MRRVSVWLLGLIVSAPLWAQTPQGTLRVEVYDLVTGSSLNNATVRVVSNDNSIDRTASTGSGNAVSFSNLPINLTYTITVSRTDYRTRTLGGIVLQRDTTNYFYAYLTSTLGTVGSVSGVVRNAMNGQPLANAYVGATLNNRTVWTYTDANGRYTISDLPRATYSITADAQGYHSQRVTAAVTPNQTTTADLVLTPRSEPVGDLYGYVYDILTGSNVNNATVTLISDLGWSLTVNTGDGNSYRWDNLPVRTRYRLAATAENYRSTSRVDIVLSTAYDTQIDLYPASVLTPAGSLSGRVYDIRTGSPIPNAFVQLSRSGRPVSVFADANGVFQFNDLAPATYTFYAWHPLYLDQTLDNVPIQQGANTADMLLTPHGAPVGGFRFYGYNFATGGSVSNMTIRITVPTGRSMVTYSGSGSSSEFVGNLPVGVPLRIEAFAPDFRSRRYDNRYVRLRQTDDFNIWFVSEDINVGRLRGRVTDLFTGAGIPNAYVFLSQVGTGRWAITYTDASGNFVADELFPTTYNVEIGAPGYYASTAFNIPVAIGDNLMEYALTPYNYPSGRLYGDVVNAANNQGISNSVVLLISSTGTTRLTYTGSGSQYNFYNLPYDQRYTVIGRAAGFQPGQVSNIEVPAFDEVYVRIPLNAGGAGLVGRLALQGFTGNPAGRVQARVQIRDRSTNQVVRDATVTLGDSGAFTVPNVPSGTFKVWIKARGWLATLTDGITIPNLLPIAFQSGAHGDVNGDNVINDADLLEVLLNFGQSGANLNPDVNYDGVVNDSDLLVILLNFGQRGDS
ncbi:MAG: carboxypeptidase regulatory-like domain-containing protein [Fimbriimonadales bacterium]|nr:carboxypeptidase regulatory-like domain-containing protein [Fimbriimonadales bacterium]